MGCIQVKLFINMSAINLLHVSQVSKMNCTRGRVKVCFNLDIFQPLDLNDSSLSDKFLQPE